MTRKVLLLVAFIAATGIVQAQAPITVPKLPSKATAPPPSAYCLPVSAGFLESEAKAAEEMRKCARGDTVVIPVRVAGAVARMCDFSKAVVALGDNVACVMVFPERGSK
jgi:hypothetical protein